MRLWPKPIVCLKNGKPGPGNELIAKTAKALSQMYRLPVLTQSEIELADDSLLYVYIYRGQTGGHSTMACNTYTITEAQASFCKKRGWKKIIVVAFPLHMGRAIWTYQLFGLETMPANMPKTGYAHSELIHWSHRKEWLFFLREILVRVFFFLQKKI